MKKLALLLLISNSAFGGIANSNYESTMNNLIEDAITKECGRMKDLTLVTSVVVEDPIDQGVTDLIYTTTLSGEQLYDQNIYDEYEITVVTDYYDLYDHEAREYGSFNVKSVNCNML